MSIEPNSKYGKWTILGVEGRHRLVQCECGNTSKVILYDLKKGKTTMCLPCSKQLRFGRKMPTTTKHGLSDTPTMWVWSDMKRRCLNPTRRGYENYGGRGITICQRWLDSFSNFLNDMGARPTSNHQLDRKDNEGHYTPENCHWVPKAEQNYNKRNTWKIPAFGKIYTAETALAEFGISSSTLRSRIVTYNWDPEKALTTPVKKRKT